MKQIFSFFFFLIFIGASYSQNYTYPYQDPSVSVDLRVEDLISKLSLGEKASLMLYNSPAIEMADKIADGLNYVGTMAVEFFISTEGDILANEIAPRPHNSGHFTLDACHTSQFEQQVRMLCGLPAGDCTLTTPVVMINLLGDVWGSSAPNWDKLLQESNIKLQLYGKKEARAGRKMGHFNVLAETTEQAGTLANKIFAELQAK